MKTEFRVMKLSELKPAEYNPRKISDIALEGLENTIEEFGLVQNLVWNKRTGNLVGGHQRMKVLTGKHVEDAMVCIVDLPEEKEKALNIALNNPHISGEFDDDGLQELLGEIADDDAQLLRDIHLDRLMDDVVDDIGGEEGEEELIPLPEDPISKLGDLWILGGHRLLCGSSTEHSDVMRLIGEDSASCMWTDPPYGVDYVGKTKEAKTIKNDGAKGLKKLLDGAFGLAFEYVLRPNSAVYVAHPPGPNFLVFYEALGVAGFTYKQMLMWAKSSFAMGRSDYHYQHEPIWYGCKPGDGRFGRMFEGDGWFGDHSQSSVFNVDKPRVNKEHPTMKPVELVVKMIINSSRVDDFVYEPFCGSGSTLIACEQTRRGCLGIELDPAYCDVIVARWERHTGLKAALVGSE